MTLAQQRDIIQIALDQAQIHEEQERISFLVATCQAEALRQEMASVQGKISRAAEEEEHEKR